MQDLSGKKVLMIIARKDFRDEELEQPKTVLEGKGATVTLASSRLETARGMLGATAKAEILIDDVNVADYDAIVFVGGMGSSEYWDNATAHKIARDTIAQGKVLASICIAPVTLARAGVLKGKKATCWPDVKANVTAGGALYTGEPVQVDGKIITGDGPGSAEKFGQALAQALVE